MALQGFRQNLFQVTSFAVLQAAMAIGAQINVVSRGVTFANLWALIDRNDATMRVTLNTRAQELQAIVRIPAQGSFPPSGLINDDQFTDDQGHTFSIRKIENPDGVGAVYKLTGVQTTTKQVGVVGQ